MIIELGSPHIWMRFVKSSNTEVSGVSEVPQSRGKLIFQEAQLLCFCSKSDLDRQHVCRSVTQNLDKDGLLIICDSFLTHCQQCVIFFKHCWQSTDSVCNQVDVHTNLTKSWSTLRPGFWTKLDNTLVFLKFNFEKSYKMFPILPHSWRVWQTRPSPYIGTFGCQPAKNLLSMVSRVLWGLTIRIRVRVRG